MSDILIVHGPNINLLGSREPHWYGTENLTDFNLKLNRLAQELGNTLEIFQSNHEGVLVDHLQSARNLHDFIIFNPGGLTHTSIVLRDTLLAINKPFLEVHLSNIHRREAFRQHSYFSDIALGIITGLGTEGYLLALRYANSYLKSTTQNNRREQIHGHA